MSALLQQLARSRPDNWPDTEALAMALEAHRCVALAADNGDDWLAADTACLLAQKPCVPLPHFFSAQQLQWAVDRAGVDALLTDKPALALWQQCGFTRIDKPVTHGSLYLLRRQCSFVELPRGTAKITFTSGSTGQPKGVCLSQRSLEQVAHSIAGVMQATRVGSHLCALPLPVLLENVAGSMAATLAGIRCHAPALSQIGWRGSSQWDARTFLRTVADRHIGSAIVLPQMLYAMLPLLKEFDTRSLTLLAVGGARVSPALLQQARTAGLPVYEGYGLSECGSVVCFNYPDADKPGTVGRPLPHVQTRVNESGELEIAGSACLGYLGDKLSTDHESTSSAWWPSGDLASIDNEGFVSIHGRKKNLIISSFGRNISPEWIESELLSQTGIVQAAVFGEARPALCAIVVAPTLSDAGLQQAVDAANMNLPDYARVQHVLRATTAFLPSNGLATGNGRNKREAIHAAYAQDINHFYPANEENTACLA